MQDENLVLLDNPDGVKSQIAPVVAQIGRSDFDCNLVLPRKIIIESPTVFGKILYTLPAERESAGRELP